MISNKKIALENLWDCLVIIIKRVVFLVGAYSTVYQVVTSLFIELLKETIIIKYSHEITISILCVGSISIILYTVYEFFSNEVIVKVEHANEIHKIIIKIGNYEDNMESVINNCEKNNKQCIFVIGINDSVDMSMAERDGVHRSVLNKYYCDKKDLNDLQRKVNQSFKERKLFSGEYGNIGTVSHNDNSRIMFVINSKYEGENSIVGPQPTEIIKKVFKELEKEKVDIVQIPVLSSINVKCKDNSIKYSITIVEIIEEYFKAILNPNNIDYDLIISIRKEDLKRKSITVSNIIKTINSIKYMYHIK